MGLAELLELQAGVASRAQLLAVGISRHALDWKLDSQRWSRPLPGVYAAQPTDLSQAQREWASLLWAGESAWLAGATAAALDGLKGFADATVHLVIPASRKLVLPSTLAWPIRVTRSRLLGAEHVHPHRRPRRTRIARSLIDLAASRAREDDAFAVLASGVQQRLVRPSDLSVTLTALGRVRHGGVMREAIRDLAGGSQSLPEREAISVIRRAGLPLPSRQVVRMQKGRRRYLDLYWDDYGLVVEIDGLAHMEIAHWMDDMERSNDLVAIGDSVLRFSVFVIRRKPEEVVCVITAALLARGWSHVS